MKILVAYQATIKGLARRLFSSMEFSSFFLPLSKYWAQTRNNGGYQLTPLHFRKRKTDEKTVSSFPTSQDFCNQILLWLNNYANLYSNCGKNYLHRYLFPFFLLLWEGRHTTFLLTVCQKSSWGENINLGNFFFFPNGKNVKWYSR